MFNKQRFNESYIFPLLVQVGGNIFLKIFPPPPLPGREDLLLHQFTWLDFSTESFRFPSNRRIVAALPMARPIIIFQLLMVSEIIGPNSILKVKVTSARSKVKSRLYLDGAHLHLSDSVPSINFLHLTVSEI